jgi:hypothetical protein
MDFPPIESSSGFYQIGQGSLGLQRNDAFNDDRITTVYRRSMKEVIMILSRSMFDLTAEIDAMYSLEKELAQVSGFLVPIESSQCLLNHFSTCGRPLNSSSV